MPASDGRRVCVNGKRWTVCLLRSHHWAKVPYPAIGDERTGTFLRCTRCGHENHEPATGFTILGG